MKITKLQTGSDQQSHFIEIDTGPTTTEKLGNYSLPFPVKELLFREFEPGSTFDWHPAPQLQYIVYLEGEVEVMVGSGEKRIFRAGDILLAADLTGQGHVSKTLTKGRSVIIRA